MAKSQRKLGMLLSYGGNLLLVAVNIFITPFLIKSLGDAEYGVYQMMASLAGYLVLMNFGTSTVMTRYVSMYLGKGDKKGERNYIAMCLMITGVLMALIIAVAAVMYFFIDDIFAVSLTQKQIEKSQQLFLILALTLVITLAAQAVQGIIVAYEKFVFSSGWNLVRPVLKAGLLVTLFMIKADSLVIVLVDLLISVIYLGACCIYAFGVLKATPKLYKFDKTIFFSSAAFSLAIMLQAIVNQVNTRVDTTILGIMVSPESVTIYSVAMQVFQVFSSLSTAAVAIYLPKFTKMVASGDCTGEKLTGAMIPPSRLQTLISGAITFGFIVCGRDFIHMWMGEGYQQAYVIALIVMIPNFLVYTNSVVESVLDAMQKRLVRSVVLCCVAVANILISIVFVHFFGAIGAPVGTALTTVAGPLIIMNIYYQKAVGIGLRQLFCGIFKGIMPCLLISAAVSLPLAILLPVSVWGLFVKGGVFVAVLVLTLMLFGFNKDEKTTVVRFLKGKELR